GEKSRPENQNIFIVGGLVRGLLAFLNTQLQHHSLAEVLQMPIPRSDQLLFQESEQNLLNLSQFSASQLSKLVDTMALNPFRVEDPGLVSEDLKAGRLTLQLPQELASRVALVLQALRFQRELSFLEIAPPLEELRIILLELDESEIKNLRKK